MYFTYTAVWMKLKYLYDKKLLYILKKYLILDATEVIKVEGQKRQMQFADFHRKWTDFYN